MKEIKQIAWNALKRSLGMWAMWFINMIVYTGTIIYSTTPHSETRLLAINAIMWHVFWALYFVPVSMIREIKEQ